MDVQCSIEDKIAHIRLVSPERANALRQQTFDELKDIARNISRNPDVGAVVISAEGPVFCGGGDLKAFVKEEDFDAFVYDAATTLHSALDLFNQTNAPIIAAVDGSVGGAGVSLVAACDLVIVSEKVKFTLGYSAIGLTPDGSASFYLSRAIGLKRTLDLALTNRTIDAETAYDWGLVTRKAEAGKVLDEAMSLAKVLVSRDTQVLGETKRLFTDGTNRDLREAMARETEAVSKMAARPIVKEFMSAFLGKKGPKAK